MRLFTAKEKLSSSELPIELIADQLGFSDNSNFAKFFKRQTGLTPKQYRTTEQK
ncbi:helix-turn-helix domain-containing protein [Oleiphilus sp. HI0125]|uniref:helix-turn-helix domain-containing protein n=1 Tax=Oleiphilus sp. HI0125 TaxID=1822266 RepID=UPI00351683EE